MGLVATLFEEGWQKGRHEGRQREGPRCRYGCWNFALDRWQKPLRERMRSADAGILLLWSERILTAAALEDVVKR